MGEPKGPEKYAAVAILIYKNKEILFIKRSENMPTHKGDIAFPGGKKEDGDVGIYSTAKREAYEELLNQILIKMKFKKYFMNQLKN